MNSLLKYLRATTIILYFAAAIGCMGFIFYLFYLDHQMALTVEKVKSFSATLDELNAADLSLINARAISPKIFKLFLAISVIAELLMVFFLVKWPNKKNLFIALLILGLAPGMAVLRQNFKSTYTSATFNDNKGIQVFYYTDPAYNHLAFQRNPLFISTQGITYYEEYLAGNDSSLTKFKNVIDWLIENRMVKGDGSYFVCEFDFPFRNMKAPWGSALYNSRALQVFILAHEHYQDPKYLELAQSCIVPYTVPISQGGFLYELSDDKWWYAEYPQSEGEQEMVLNGMISVITSLDTYYQYSGDSLALSLINKGTKAVRDNIHSYDDNGATFYNILQEPADYKYHLMHVSQMGQLYTITGDTIFRYYQSKWKAHADEQGWHW